MNSVKSLFLARSLCFYLPRPPDGVWSERRLARRRGGCWERRGCAARVHRDHRAAGGERAAGYQEGKLSVCGRDELEAAVHLGSVGRRHAGWWRALTRRHWDGHVRRAGDLHHWLSESRRRRGCGVCLRRVVHGVQLGHAVGQVAEQPRAHLGVHALACGQKTRHLVHALAEACAVLAEHGGVRVQSSCKTRNGVLSFILTRPSLHHNVISA